MVDMLFLSSLYVNSKKGLFSDQEVSVLMRIDYVTEAGTSEPQPISS